MHSYDPAGTARFRHAALAALLAAGLALAAAPVLAAEAKPRSAFADTTKPVLFLKETVVTGARYPRVFYESPQALSFISRQMLREQAPIVLGDVLARVPGVESNQDSPWEQRPSIRGVTGQRVLVLMDGVPMNSVRGNGPHPSLVDPSQVERIEVVRGPSSVAYGSDALGGVINIITRGAQAPDGATALRGSASLSGSSAEMLRGGTLELRPRIGKFSAFVSGGIGRAEDYAVPDSTIPNSAFRQYQVLADLRYDLGRRLTAKAGWQQYRGQDIGVPGLNFIRPGDVGLFSFPFYRRDLAHLTLEEGYGKSWLASSRVRVYWQRENRNFFSRHDVTAENFYSDQYLGFHPSYNPASSSAASIHQMQDRYFDLNTYGAQLQMTSVKTTRTLFTAGLDAASDRTSGDNLRFRTYHYRSLTGGDSAGVTSRRVTASVPVGRFDNYGSYLQGEWYVRPRWTLNAGGRYTHYRYRTNRGLSSPAAGPGVPAVYFEPKSVDDDALSGSLGLVYAPAQELHLSANVANGYREPNAQDLFFNGPGSAAPLVKGDPGLKPEKSVSYDLGIRWSPGAVALSGNAFYSTFKDLINALPVDATTYQYTNIATATIWGGEGEAEWAFRPTWTVRTALSGSVGDITSREAIRKIYFSSGTPPSTVPDHVPLELVPPFRGTSSLRWTAAGRRFWGEAAARYSWRTNRLPPPIPNVGQLSTFKKEWIVGDLSAGANLETGQRLVLGVRNFTNRTYRPALSSVVQPGATYYVSLSSDF